MIAAKGYDRHVDWTLACYFRASAAKALRAASIACRFSERAASRRGHTHSGIGRSPLAQRRTRRSSIPRRRERGRCQCPPRSRLAAAARRSGLVSVYSEPLFLGFWATASLVDVLPGGENDGAGLVPTATRTRQENGPIPAESLVDWNHGFLVRGSALSISGPNRHPR